MSPPPPPPPVVAASTTAAVAHLNNVGKSEWNTGLNPYVFIISMWPVSAVPVTVYWSTLDGTAVAGSDYAAACGSVTFAPGQLYGSFIVNVLGDKIAEPDEAFRVLLTSSGTKIDPLGGLGTITNDDGPYLAPGPLFLAPEETRRLVGVLS